MNSRFPNTARMENSPRISDTFKGVMIDSKEQDFVKGDYIIYGGIQLPKAEFEMIKPNPFRGIVLVYYMNNSLCGTCNPLKTIITFEDDFKKAGEHMRGYFNLDLRLSLPEFMKELKPQYRFYITISLNIYLSKAQMITIHHL